MSQEEKLPKILIVEDDERLARNELKRLLENFPHIEVIAEASNTDEASALLETLQPDVLFLDIQMPDGTGFDLLRAIPDKNFEVIFITAHEEFAIKAIKFSALDYILKPVDPEELLPFGEQFGIAIELGQCFT